MISTLETRKIIMEKFGVEFMFIQCFSSKILTRDIYYLCTKKKRIYPRGYVALSTNKERLKIDKMCMQLYIFFYIFRRKISKNFVTTLTFIYMLCSCSVVN
jgi:hypothetical protein